MLLSVAVMFTFMPAVAFADEEMQVNETTDATVTEPVEETPLVEEETPAKETIPAAEEEVSAPVTEKAESASNAEEEEPASADEKAVSAPSAEEAEEPIIAVPAASGWVKDTYEGFDYYWYYDPATGKMQTGWKKIGGYWYYFAKANDENGWPEGSIYDAGVMSVNGKWYYFGLYNGPASKWGKMQTGWVKEGETWRYADPANDGQLAVGWKKIGGKWYFFSYDPDNGYYFDMLANATWSIDNTLYAFERNGALHEKAGWVDLYEETTDENGNTLRESYWVYTNSKGVAATGWKKIDGYWYYLGDAGYMYANQFAKDSAGWCYLGANGKMVKNKWIKDDGDWYYIKSDGHMAANAWVKDSGGWLYVGSDGKMVTEGWAKDSRGWCWLDENGRITKNQFIQDKGNMYYLKADGYMAHNEEVVIGGTSYKFKANGALDALGYLHGMVDEKGYVNGNGDKTVSFKVNDQAVVYFVNHSYSVELIYYVSELQLMVKMEMPFAEPTILDATITRAGEYRAKVKKATYTKQTTLTLTDNNGVVTDTSVSNLYNTAFKAAMAAWQAGLIAEFDTNLGMFGFISY